MQRSNMERPGLQGDERFHNFVLLSMSLFHYPKAYTQANGLEVRGECASDLLSRYRRILLWEKQRNCRLLR